MDTHAQSYTYTHTHKHIPVGAKSAKSFDPSTGRQIILPGTSVRIQWLGGVSHLVLRETCIDRIWWLFLQGNVGEHGRTWENHVCQRNWTHSIESMPYDSRMSITKRKGDSQISQLSTVLAQVNILSMDSKLPDKRDMFNIVQPSHRSQDSGGP